jgi:hypothetical protein
MIMSEEQQKERYALRAKILRKSLELYALHYPHKLYINKRGKIRYIKRGIYSLNHFFGVSRSTIWKWTHTGRIAKRCEKILIHKGVLPYPLL